jgi:NodT family efflux transporter outer membrane factor (OMF) lipoprotein
VKRLPATLLAAALLVACSTTPAPPAPAQAPARFLRADAAAFDARWWQQLNDPLLERLLAAAQSDNLDIAQALARLRAARAGAEAQGTRQMPSLALNASASNSESGLPEAVKRGQPDTRALRGALELQWELDLFGAARAAQRAARAEADAAEAGVQGARLLVQTELAGHYAQWQSARLRLQSLDALLDQQHGLVRLAERRAAEGQAARLDLESLHGEAATLQAQRAPLQLLQQHSEHRLALLLGRPASAPLPELQDSAAALPAVPPLAPGQPLALLLRRPDLAAAEAQAQAARARADERQAERWPRLALQLLWGRQDLRLNGADLAPSPYRFAALAFAQPLFNAGRLQQVAEAADAQADGARLQQHQAWLTALAEVESALAGLHASREREGLLREQLIAAERLAAHTQRLASEGLTGRSPLLAAQKNRHAAQLALLQARTQTLLDALQLMKALGGTWSPTA